MSEPRLTALQIKQLNNMNAAAQRADLGTRLDEIQYDGVPDVSAGTVLGMNVISYSITPALASTTGVHAAITLPTSGTTVVTTSITNPDFPRQITITGNAAGITGNVVIVGTDIADAALTETLVAVDNTTVTSTKAFKTVTSITVPTRTTAGDTISVGTGAKVGFPVAIPQTTRVLAKNFNGSTDAGTVTAGATAPLSVYAAAGSFDGAKVLELIFIA
jgi:hypothetical protein